MLVAVHNSLRRQRGFTLMEIMVGIAIMAIGMAALAWGINQAFDESQIKEEAKALTYVRTQMLPYIDGNSATTSDLRAPLVAQDEIPPGWSVNRATTPPVVRNSWGGEVSFADSGAEGAMLYQRVPRKACVELLVKLHRGKSFAATRATTTTPVDVDGDGLISTSEAALACTSDTSNSIWWKVYL